MLSGIASDPLVHAPRPVDSDVTFAPAPVDRDSRFWIRVAAAVLLVIAVVALVVLLRGGSDTPKTQDPGVPSGVPTKFQQPLSDLHDAVNGAAK